MPIYSTPVWQSEYENFEENREKFLEFVHNYRENNPEGKNVSNVGGYQSPKTLQLEGVFSDLYDHICSIALKAASDLDFIDLDIGISSAWININDHKGCINAQHIHDSVFAGVFYLSAPEGSGKLILKNTSMNEMWPGSKLSSEKNQFTATDVQIDPVEGDIILWPSYLPHSVNPNTHDGERISISFNIDFAPKGSLRS